MTVTELIKQNYKQPKYMLPAIVYFPLLFTGYTVCNLFATEKADIGDNKLETVEHLNDKIPEAHIKGDGLGNKYDSMLEVYGKIKDESAVENIQKQEEKKEEYNSKYSDAELAALEEQSKESEKAAEELRKMQQSMRESQNRNSGLADTRIGCNTPEEEATLNELQQALAQARQQATGQTVSSQQQQGTQTPQLEISAKGSVTAEQKPSNPMAVKEIEEDAEPEEVVMKTQERSDFFNTVGSNEPERKLIKAIIDEDIKVVDGSRIRLRVLDDMEIGQTTIPKGTYLYATMSGFNQQRIKGTVKSVFLNENLIKINLSIYDTDGLEGLYVPESSFRSTAQDVGSQTLNTTPNFNTGTTIESAFVQWGMNAVQQGVQKTSQAISKAIKKNRVKLKYGTVVYLINSKERKKQEAPQYQQQQLEQQQKQIQAFQNIIQNANR